MQLDPFAMAFIGSTSLLLFFLESFVHAISYAVQVYSARETTTQSSYTIVFHGLILSILFSIPVCVWMYFSAAELLLKFSAIPSLSAHHQTYLALQTCSFFCHSIILLFRGFFSGQRRNDLFFKVIFVLVSSQIILNLAFVSGYLGNLFHPLTSIGIADCLAKLFGLLYYAVCFWRGCQHDNALLPRFSLPLLLKISFFVYPLYAFSVLDHYATISLYKLANGTLDTTGYQSLHIVFSVLGCLPGMGFGLAAISPVSFHFGQKQYARAYDAILRFSLLGGLCMLSVSLLGILCMPTVITSFIKDIDLASRAYTSMQIMLMTAGVHVACQVSMRSMQALDQTRLCTRINLIVVYACRLLLGAFWYFEYHIDIHHIFIALFIEKMLKLSWMQVYMYKYLRHMARDQSDALSPSPMVNKS